jgi:FtsP/CotA-like multicopper oxidase with cupredoxin domain
VCVCRFLRAPESTFTYEFPIRQSGTYWYHTHSELQEQSGLYGAIVIEPIGKLSSVDRDYVILFSDWTDEDPHGVLRTLKRGSEWYAIRKKSGQSILGAVRLGMLGDYFMRELQRMPAMDISDVAYDLFLANGRTEIDLPADPGEVVRLRVIDGSSTTNFHLEFAGGPMTIVAADGPAVEPIEENRFLIAVAETYDVLIRVQSAGAYEFAQPRTMAQGMRRYGSVRVTVIPRLMCLSRISIKGWDTSLSKAYSPSLRQAPWACLTVPLMRVILMSQEWP